MVIESEGVMGTPEFAASWSKVQVAWGPQPSAIVSGEGGHVGDHACHWGSVLTLVVAPQVR